MPHSFVIGTHPDGPELGFRDRPRTRSNGVQTRVLWPTRAMRAGDQPASSNPV